MKGRAPSQPEPAGLPPTKARRPARVRAAVGGARSPHWQLVRPRLVGLVAVALAVLLSAQVVAGATAGCGTAPRADRERVETREKRFRERSLPGSRIASAPGRRTTGTLPTRDPLLAGFLHEGARTPASVDGAANPVDPGVWDARIHALATGTRLVNLTAHQRLLDSGIEALLAATAWLERRVNLARTRLTDPFGPPTEQLHVARVLDLMLSFVASTPPGGAVDRDGPFSGVARQVARLLDVGAAHQLRELALRVLGYVFTHREAGTLVAGMEGASPVLRHAIAEALTVQRVPLPAGWATRTRVSEFSAHMEPVWRSEAAPAWRRSSFGPTTPIVAGLSIVGPAPRLALIGPVTKVELDRARAFSPDLPWRAAVDRLAVVRARTLAVGKPLIALLRSDDPVARAVAANALRTLTGTNQRYEPGADPFQLQQSIVRWRLAWRAYHRQVPAPPRSA